MAAGQDMSRFRRIRRALRGFFLCCACGEADTSRFRRILRALRGFFLCCACGEAGEPQLTVPVQETSPASLNWSSVRPWFSRNGSMEYDDLTSPLIEYAHRTVYMTTGHEEFARL